MSSGGRSNFTGKVIDPEKTWNGDIMLYVEPGLNTMEIQDIPFAQWTVASLAGVFFWGGGREEIQAPLKTPAWEAK